MQQTNGSIAQLGEHLPYKQRVIGSSPIVPTKTKILIRKCQDLYFIHYQIFPKKAMKTVTDLHGIII